MGIIVLTIAILPILGIGGMELFLAEATGPTADKLHPRITQTAKRLWYIYLGLTLSETILFKVAGMGWFDAVNVKYACRLSGVTSLCITKLDVLDQFPEIKICTAYEPPGNHVEAGVPQSNKSMQRVPVYERVPGWGTRTAGIRSWEDLPGQAKRFLERLSELTEVSVDIVSTGADRDDTLIVHNPFD